MPLAFQHVNLSIPREPFNFKKLRRRRRIRATLCVVHGMKLFSQSRESQAPFRRSSKARSFQLALIRYRDAIIASSRWRSSPVRNATLRHKLSLSIALALRVDYTEAAMIMVREAREPDQNRYKHRATGFPLRESRFRLTLRCYPRRYAR